MSPSLTCSWQHAPAQGLRRLDVALGFTPQGKDCTVHSPVLHTYAVYTETDAHTHDPTLMPVPLAYMTCQTAEFMRTVISSSTGPSGMSGT